MVYEDLECIFVHIPKTAGISITTFLNEHSKDTYLDSKIFMHNFYLDYHKAMKEYGVDPECYLKFAVVRNPYTRAESYWRYKFHRYTDSLPTFADFIEWGIGSYTGEVKQTNKKKHWRAGFRQCEFLKGPDGKIGVDIICKQENLDEDIKEVFQDLKLPEKLGVDLDELKLPRLNTASSPEHMEISKGVWTPKLRKKFTEHVKEDFELFGYEI